MRRRYDRELEKLNDDLSDMGSLISDRITMAIYSMINGDKDTSLVIRQSDDEVDDYESKIESRALKLILKEQPVASDLRLISAALKMITDMERIGDHVYNIYNSIIDPMSEKIEITGLKVKGVNRDV